MSGRAGRLIEVIHTVALEELPDLLWKTMRKTDQIMWMRHALRVCGCPYVKRGALINDRYTAKHWERLKYYSD